MKISDTRAFVNQALFGALVTIGFGGSVGLGTVWMRHQVTVVADNNRVLQQQIEDIDRRIANTTALVEEAQSSDVLRGENESMRLGLIEMNQTQVIPVTEDPVLRLAARANRRVFEAERGNESVSITLNIEPPPAALTKAAAVVASRSSTSTGNAPAHTGKARPTRGQYALSE
jgi:hypothetical protein